MRFYSGLLLTVSIAALASLAGCDKGGKQPDLSSLGPSALAATTVLPVGSPECPHGGTRFDIGKDANGNGILESSEIASNFPACASGTENGLLMKIESEPTGTQPCIGGGMKIMTGIDANMNRVLDPSEVAHTEHLCAGRPGAVGITLDLSAPAAPPAKDEDKKKTDKTAPSKKAPAPSAAPEREQPKATTKPAPQPAAAPKQEGSKQPAPTMAEKQAAPSESAATRNNDKKDAPTAKVVKEPATPTPAPKAVKDAPAPAPTPKGWINVSLKAPQLASAAYKIEGRYIIVRFTNLSGGSSVRFKYTVKWKENKNGKWVDESTMEGISFRLKPLDSMDREILTRGDDVKDVVAEIDVNETS